MSWQISLPKSSFLKGVLLYFGLETLFWIAIGIVLIPELIAVFVFGVSQTVATLVFVLTVPVAVVGFFAVLGWRKRGGEGG